MNDISLMYELKKIEKYLRINLLGPGPRLMTKEFTGPRSHKGLRNADLKNAYTEFHKYPTNGLVADTRSQTNGCGLHIRRPVLVRKEHLISNEVE